MGESYLRRKLLGRMRRAKTQASMSASSLQQPGSSFCQRIPAGCGQSHQQELAAPPLASSLGLPSIESGRPPPRVPANSASTPQLAMIREQQRAPAEEAGPTSKLAAPTSSSDRQDSPTLADSVAGASTAASAAAAPTRAPLTRSPHGSASNGPLSKGKLRSASRAIQFFRRTASSLTSSSSSGRLVSGSGGGGRVSRQDTGDSGRSQQSSSNGGHPRPHSSASSHAFGAILSSGNTTTASSTNGNGQCPTSAATSTNANNYSSSGNCCEMPQFIVPKLNALRLPLVCLIKSLDGELMREVFVHRYELGQYLIESLKVSVGANDCKYFGLKMAKSLDEQEDLRNPWLDLNESVCKQIKSSTKLGLFQAAQAPNGKGSNSNNNSNASTTARSIEFYLRIKFYPPNLARVQDSFLRNYLWLQLRRDLRLGKLTSSMNNLTLLMACVLQFELGDHKQELLERVPELSILPNQDLIEEQANELWRVRLCGLKRHQAQMQFLRAAVILETYGFDYWPVRDHQRQRAYLLGFNYAGIKTIRNGRIVHHFRWHSLSKISYERRMIIFHIYPAENSKRKQILGFKCLSNEDCQNLYMRLLEQKYFFTVDLAYFDKSLRRPSCLYAQASSSNANCDTLDWFDEAEPSEQGFSPNANLDSIEPASDGQACHELAASHAQPAATTASGAPKANNHSHYHPQLAALVSGRPDAPTVCPARCSAGCQFCSAATSGQPDCYSHSLPFEQNWAAWQRSQPACQQQQARPNSPTAQTRQANLRGQQQRQLSSRRLHRQQSTMEYISSSDDEREDDAGEARAPQSCTARHGNDSGGWNVSAAGLSALLWWLAASGKRLSWLSSPIGRLQLRADSIGQWLMRMVGSMLEQSHTALSAHCRRQQEAEQGEQARWHRLPITFHCGGHEDDCANNDHDDDIAAGDDENFDDDDHDEQQQHRQRRQKPQKEEGASPQVGSFDSSIRFLLLLLLMSLVFRVGEDFWASLVEMLAFGRDDERAQSALVGDEQLIIDGGDDL